MDFAPATKIRREDMESSQQHISIHNSLYFENGNIVLLSLPKDNVVTAFKVYKDFLFLYSPVFEGMLSLPPHPDVETYDGVPLVRLPDEATDLIPFLSAVYYPTHIPSRRDFYVADDKVESVFKLSKKYQCDALHQCMKDKLLEIWPLDLIAWDRFVESKISRKRTERSKRARVRWDGDSDDSSDDSREENDPGSSRSSGPQAYELNPASVLPDPCSAIRLAREYDVPQIRPAAFYHLFCTVPSAFSHTDTEDGDHWGRSNSPFGSRVNFALLSRREIMCFIQGSYAIRELYISIKKKINKILAGCGDKKCQESHSALRSFVEENMRDTKSHVDILEILRRSKTSDNLSDMIPEDFIQRYNNYARDTRFLVWDSLSELFALYNL